MLVTYLTGAVGVVVLVVVLLVLLGRFRKFSAAAVELRGGLERGTGALPALRSRSR